MKPQRYRGVPLVRLCSSCFLTPSSEHDHRDNEEGYRDDADQSSSLVELNGPNQIRMSLNVRAHIAERPSDPAHEGVRLHPRRDGRVRCRWFGITCLVGVRD